MTTLADIIENSGDSIIRTYSYASGLLTVVLVLGENDRKVELKMPTNYLSFDTHYLANEVDSFRTCRVTIQDLSQVLSVANGVYMSAIDFGKLMQETRANYTLAYGKEASKWKYLFSLVGYSRLISCLLSELDTISIKEMPE